MYWNPICRINAFENLHFRTNVSKCFDCLKEELSDKMGFDTKTWYLKKNKLEPFEVLKGFFFEKISKFQTSVFCRVFSSELKMNGDFLCHWQMFKKIRVKLSKLFVSIKKIHLRRNNGYFEPPESVLNKKKSSKSLCLYPPSFNAI